VTGHGAHSHKKNGGKLPPEFGPRVPKRVGFSVINATRPFGRLPSLISTIFETAGVNRFPHAYTGEKFCNFCAGVFKVPKLLNIQYSRVGCCDRAAAQTVQWAMEIISGASRHPKDVSFVREFCWGRTVWAL